MKTQDLGNFYAPNTDDPIYFRDSLELIEKFENTTKMIGGDMNLVMDLKIDKLGGRPITHFKARDILKVYLEESDME